MRHFFCMLRAKATCTPERRVQVVYDIICNHGDDALEEEDCWKMTLLEHAYISQDMKTMDVLLAFGAKLHNLQLKVCVDPNIVMALFDRGAGVDLVQFSKIALFVWQKNMTYFAQDQWRDDVSIAVLQYAARRSGNVHACAELNRVERVQKRWSACRRMWLSALCKHP
jgi:hypothetical protein